MSEQQTAANDPDRRADLDVADRSDHNRNGGSEPGAAVLQYCLLAGALFALIGSIAMVTSGK
ncbi:hypothetical protein ACFFWD_20725 [Bradyrhizobium erythrophlei]|uniref:hypothetical protein n=1 Tax=Bradyrhizobium erythrophlei TaxID=1437360 RepID=UPI0035EDDE94